MSAARRRPRLLVAFLIMVLLCPVLAAAPPARAAGPCDVTDAGNSGAGTLRDLLAGACATITFALPPAANGTITLAGTLLVTRQVTISGPGSGQLTIQGNNTFPLLFVNAHDAPGTPGMAVAISGLTLTKGQAVTYYGGNLRSWQANLTLTDVALTNGTAVGNAGGAGLGIASGTVRLDRVTVSGNTAAGNSQYGTGAGISIEDYYGTTDVAVTNSVIADNRDTGGHHGGGLAIFHDRPGTPAPTSILALTNTIVRGNTAGSGGGLYAAGGTGNYDSSGTVTLTNTAVVGNAATGQGGGILASDTKLVVVNSTVAQNTAGASGGGIGAGTFGSTTVTNSTVADNIAGGTGGGISGALTILTATTLAYNRAGSGTGGLAVSGYGDPNATIDRSIVAGNTVGQVPQDCLISGQSKVVSQGYNLVGTGCTAGSTDITLTGAVSGVLDPTLRDNGGPTQTHNLVPGSPAIDRIPLASCTLGNDQRGVTRPQPAGGTCDIGAVEYTPALPSSAPCGQRFGDVPGSDPACVAIEALAGRGVIKGCDQEAVPPLFCPTAPTLRAQMAALIVRAMAWGSETPTNPFSDQCDPLNAQNCVDGELWNAVGILAAKGVAKGYTDGATCAPAPAPCYAPRDNVLFAQTISFITRAMVQKGYWTQATADDGSVYPNIPQASGHRLDFVTYTQNVGPVPGTASATQEFAAWDQAATRAWFAQALWLALQGH